MPFNIQNSYCFWKFLEPWYISSHGPPNWLMVYPHVLSFQNSVHFLNLNPLRVDFLLQFLKLQVHYLLFVVRVRWNKVMLFMNFQLFSWWLVTCNIYFTLVIYFRYFLRWCKVYFLLWIITRIIFRVLCGIYPESTSESTPKGSVVICNNWNYCVF